jgi:hypothetical protein
MNTESRFSRTPITDELLSVLKEVDPKTGKNQLLEAAERQASKPTAKGKEFARLLPRWRRIAEALKPEQVGK